MLIQQNGSNTGDVTLGSVGDGTYSNAAGATLNGQVLNLEPADSTHPGVVNNTTQTFTGAKTFGTGPTTIVGDIVATSGDLYLRDVRLVGGHMTNLADSGAASVVGVCTLSSGTKTVSTSAVTANSRIFFQTVSRGGTMGAHYVYTVSAGTSFTVTAVDTSGSTVATDTSVLAWFIIN